MVLKRIILIYNGLVLQQQKIEQTKVGIELLLSWDDNRHQTNRLREWPLVITMQDKKL